MDQCCVFYNQNPERMIELAKFELVEDYGDHKYGHDLYDNDCGGRVLLKCKKCGRYVLWQKSTISEMYNEGDTDFITYWPVESPEEADRLNREYGGDLWRHLQGKRSVIQLTWTGDGTKKYDASIIPPFEKMNTHINGVEKLFAEELRKQGFEYSARYLEMFGGKNLNQSFRKMNSKKANDFYKRCVEEGHPWDWYFDFPEDAIF